MDNNGNSSSSSRRFTAKDAAVNHADSMMSDAKGDSASASSAEDAATGVEKEDAGNLRINEHLYVLRLSENTLATKIMAFMQPSADSYPYNRYFRTGKDLTKEEASVAWKTQGQGCADVEFMQINGVDKNVQKVLNSAYKPELEKYKQDPYDFEEEDAKLFHPMAFGKKETEFFRKQGSQYQMKNGENIKLWWANVQDAVLAYYLLKYPEASVAKAKYEQGVKDYNSGKKTSKDLDELKKAFRRSGHFMWAEWEPVQGIHRGIDWNCQEKRTPKSLVKAVKLAPSAVIGMAGMG